jgi:hypothetical protein
MYDINNNPQYAKKKAMVDEERMRDQFPFPSSSLHQKRKCDGRHKAHIQEWLYAFCWSRALNRVKKNSNNSRNY